MWKGLKRWSSVAVCPALSGSDSIRQTRSRRRTEKSSRGRSIWITPVHWLGKVLATAAVCHLVSIEASRTWKVWVGTRLSTASKCSSFALSDTRPTRRWKTSNSGRKICKGRYWPSKSRSTCSRVRSNRQLLWMLPSHSQCRSRITMCWGTRSVTRSENASSIYSKRRKTRTKRVQVSLGVIWNSESSHSRRLKKKTNQSKSHYRLSSRLSCKTTRWADSEPGAFQDSLQTHLNVTTLKPQKDRTSFLR